MAQPALDAEAFSQLSHEQKTLLDTVDSLRSQGVGEIVQLPQIIVVGDQSSGKSSVLEAISRVRFPVKGGICTRFATELVVRTASREEVVVKIRRHNALAQGTNVEFSERNFSSDALPGLIERAKVAMGVRNDANGFSEDTLRIEVSGPNLPSLTLVDLPGIYRNETADQSREGIEVVRRLVEKYMQQKNSIILAVVNASYDFSNQGILTEVKRHDPRQERTMGIVTNPDRLAPNPTEEGKYIRLIRNQEPAIQFKLGWHVLRNRGPDANDERGQGTSRTSDDDRDEMEKKFLSSGIWSPLPENLKGIDSLRRKLSKILTNHIRLSLPGVIEDIEKKLDARQETLARLGRHRAKPSELRQYLRDIAERFRDLARLAVRGTYDDQKFFGEPYEEDYPCGPHAQSDARKLRAVVRNLNHAFDAVISSKGESRKIIWEDNLASTGDEHRASDSHTDGNDKKPDGEDRDPVRPPDLYMRLYDVDDPEEISWAEAKKELEREASISLNANFPGSPNDKLALNHFRSQSKRWRDIARIHLDLVVNSAKAFVELALAHSTAGDERTCDALLREYVDPAFERHVSRLNEKLDELLMHYERGEAITLETEFLQMKAISEKRRVNSRMEEILATEYPTLLSDKLKEQLSRITMKQVLSKTLERQTSQFGLENVVDMATVYYEMSLRTFKENIIVLAVENCLMSELPSMLRSVTVPDMDKEMLERLAAESSEIKQERIGLERDIGVLTEGLRICKEQRPRESAARSSRFSSRWDTTEANGRPSSTTSLPEGWSGPVSSSASAPRTPSGQTAQSSATTGASMPEKAATPAAPTPSKPSIIDQTTKPAPNLPSAPTTLPTTTVAKPSSLFAGLSVSGSSGVGLFSAKPFISDNPSPAGPGHSLFGSSSSYSGSAPSATESKQAAAVLGLGNSPASQLFATTTSASAKPATSSGLFASYLGAQTTPTGAPASSRSGSAFGSAPTSGASGSVNPSGSGFFGSVPASGGLASAKPSGSGLFGSAPASEGFASAKPSGSGSGLFGSPPPSQGTASLPFGSRSADSGGNTAKSSIFASSSSISSAPEARSTKGELPR